MGSKGSQTVTNSGQQSQTYTPAHQIGTAGTQAINMGTTAANAPFQQPVAPVAPFSPFQNIGFGETLGLQGMAQPYFNTAGNYLAGSAAPVTGADVANYLNPFTSNVTAQLQNIFGQQNVQNTGNLVQSAGGVGADRVGVGQANMANQQTLAAGQVYSGLYQQALQAAEQNKQMQAGAGFAFGQMGPAAQAAQQNAVNQLLGVGAQQQQLSQAEMNAIYQNQLAQIAYPFQTAQYLSGITAGLAPAMGGTTQGQFSGQTTYPGPSGAAQALGVGTSLLGMFGGMGGMGALGSMGSALAGGAPFSAASQYLPGQSAYGATPMAVNGGMYPMFQRRGGRVGYDDGGQVTDNYGKLADKEYYNEQGNILAGAGRGNPMAMTLAKDLSDVYNYDDGGGIDPTLGQPSPMSLNLNPGGGGGLPFPGAGRVSGSPVPSTLLPTGRGGGSGFGGQSQYMYMHPPPSMPQGGGQQQSPMGGLGQLGGGLGKMLGGLGGGAGAAGLGAPLDLGGAGAADALGIGDMAAGAGDAAALFALVNRGGRIPRMTMGGSPGAPMTPPTPMGAGPALGTGPQAFPPPGVAAQLPPRMPGMMPPKMPGMDGGGSIDDAPTIGPGGVPMAPPQIPLPRPRPEQPRQWHQWSPGRERDVASLGGGVHPMMAGQGFDDGGEVDPAFIPEPSSGFGGMLSDTASQIGEGLSKYKDWMFDQPHPSPVIPPDVQARPGDKANPPPDNEALGYGPMQSRPTTNVARPDIVGSPPQQSMPDEDTSSVDAMAGPRVPGAPPMGRNTAVPDVVGSNLPPMDPFGHGMGGDMPRMPGAQGVIGRPMSQSQELDMAPYRRATMQQETWLPGTATGKHAGQDPYQNVSPSLNSQRQRQEALGAYGIMDFNLPQWSRDVLGREVSKQEFLSNPKIQDAIYDAKMRQYIKSYGVEGAGRAWLGGEGALNAPLRADPYGTRVGPYGHQFAEYAQQPGGGAQTALDPKYDWMRRSSNIEGTSNNVGPMGSRQVPFPNANDPNNFARRFTGSPWKALVDAGARMAQTRGPIGSVIGAGIDRAGQTLEGQRQALDSEEALNQRAEHLAMMAQQHLDHYTRMTPSEEATHEETRRWHDLIANLRSSGQFATTLAKVKADPLWSGRSEEEQEIQAARILSQGTPGAQGQQPPRPPGVPDDYVYTTVNGVKGWAKPGTQGNS